MDVDTNTSKKIIYEEDDQEFDFDSLVNHESDIIPNTRRYSMDQPRRPLKCTRRKKHNNTDASNVVTRGMDFIKKMRWNNKTTRRPSLEETTEWKSWSSTQNTPRASIDMPELILSSSTSTHTCLPPIHERALHTPSRFLPQNQAVFTTNAEGSILLFNDIASLCFGIDKSFIHQSLLTTLLEESYSNQMAIMLARRKNATRDGKGLVLVCGTIIPIIKANGMKSVASLWLKEKKTDHGEPIYIWIFEEIYETSLSVYVDSECIIRRVLGTMLEIYGYREQDIIGKPVNCLVPALAKEGRNDNLEKIDRLKFFGSQSNRGIYFPVILNLNRHVAIGDDDLANFVVKITSLPTIEGLMVLRNGAVSELNPVPAKYLFGYSVSTIVEDKKCHYSNLIPHLPALIDGLKIKGLLTENSVVSNSTCKKILREKYGEGEASVIYAVHRDGSQFEVELQLKYIDNACNVWIRYDRIDAIAKHERRLQKQKSTPFENKIKQRLLSNNDTDVLVSPITEKVLKRPIARPSRISSFGAVDNHRKIFPTLSTTQEDYTLPPSPPAHEKHPLDDYVILDILGQGTYGMAKLAYRKDDPSQKKLVIKYIIKSKIIVDSWIRDRQIGLIPMEIHILRTLQKYPHVNCCRLVTSLEDEDYYFVVMELLGDGMDLFEYIEINKNMKEDEIKRIFYQIACAVKHLHDHRIVHRDIKDENIILDAEGTVHLIDFGCATYYKKDRKFDTFTGTLEYCAPEVLKGEPYEGPPQDIWASGVLLFTLVYRENPFYNIDEIMERELRVPYIVSEGSLDLIRKMLERDVEKRIDINQVLAHPWFQT